MKEKIKLNLVKYCFVIEIYLLLLALNQLQIKPQTCFSSWRYPRLVGGNSAPTSFECIHYDSSNNIYVGGSTFDQLVSGYPAGEKPLVMSIGGSGQHKWSVIINTPNYYRVSALTLRDNHASAMAAALDSNQEDRLLIIQLNYVTGALVAQHKPSSDYRGYIGPDGIKFEQTGMLYFSLTQNGNKWMAFKYQSGSGTKSSVFVRTSNQINTEANAVVNDDGASYYYFAGSLQDSLNTPYASITITSSSGAIQQNLGINLGVSNPPWSVKRLNYYENTGTNTYCLATCTSNGQSVVLSKLNVAAASTSMNMVSSVMRTDMQECVQVIPKGTTCMAIYFLTTYQYDVKYGYIDLSTSNIFIDTISYPAHADNKFNDGYFFGASAQGFFVGSLYYYENVPTLNTLVQPAGYVMSAHQTLNDITQTITSVSQPVAYLTAYSITNFTLSSTTASLTMTPFTITSQTGDTDQMNQYEKYTIIQSNQTDQSYGVSSPIIEVQFAPFTLQQTCTDVVFTYESILTTQAASFITFTPANRTFSISTSSIANVGTFTVTIKGLINTEQYKLSSFILTVTGPCQYATVTSAVQPTNINYIVGNPSAVFTLNTFTSNTTGCGITYTLAQINGTSSSTFFNFNPSNLQLTILTSLASDKGVYQFQLTGTITGQVAFSQADLYVTLADPCINDIITPVDQTSFTYQVDSELTSTLFTLSWARTMPSCGALTYYLVDQADNTTANAIFSLIANTDVQVSTNDMSKRGTYNLRIISNSSSQFTPTVYDDFTVIVTDNCLASSITNTAVGSLDYVIGNSQISQTFAPWNIDKTVCGPISYTLFVNSTTPPTGITFDNQTRSIQIVSSDVALAGTQQFKIRGTSQYGPATYDYQFNVVISDPCETAQITQITKTNQNLAINQMPKPSLALQTFTHNVTFISCGAFTQTVTDSSNNPLDSTFTYFSTNNSILMFTNVKSKISISPYTIKISAQLVDYPSIQYSYIFNVNIAIDCQYNEITSMATQSWSYTVFNAMQTQANSLYFTNLITPECGVINSYQCKFQNNTDCTTSPSSMIQIDSTTGTLTIFSNNKLDEGTYNLQIIASNGVISQTQLITLIVSCDCRCATISPITIPDKSYDISNGTQNYLHQTLSWTNDMIGTCPFTYSIIDIDTGNLPNSTVVNLVSGNQLTISNQFTTVVTTYNLRVTGLIHAQNTANLDFKITIIDLCPGADLAPDIIPNKNYTTSDPQMLVNFNEWTTNPTYCSCYFSYTAELANGTALPSFITFNAASKQFQIQTTDIAMRGNYEIQITGAIRVTNIKTTTFNLLVKVSCAQNVIDTSNFPIASFNQYNISMPKMTLNFLDFTELTGGECGPIVYTAVYNSTISFPFLNALNFSSSSKQFEIYTSDRTLNETLLNVKLIATIGLVQSFKNFDVLMLFICFVIKNTPNLSDQQQLSQKITSYTIGSGEKILNFQNFDQNESCSYPVTYFLIAQQRSSLPYFIDISQLQSRIIKIKSDNISDAFDPDYNFRIISRVSNPNGTIDGFLDFQFKLKSVNNAPPVFVTPLKDISLEVIQQTSFSFPDLFDQDNDQFQIVSVDLGQAASFITGTYPNYQISPMISNFGSYKIKVTVKDLNPNPLQATYSLKIVVTQPNNQGQNQNNSNQVLQGVSDTKKISSTLSAYIRQIDMNGLVTVIFNQNLITPLNYTGFQNETLILRVRDNEGRIRNDIRFSWKIQDFKDKTMKIQVDFKDKGKVSKYYKDQLEIVFKLNQRFISQKDGLLIKKDYSIQRNIPKLLQDDEMTKALQQIAPTIKSSFTTMFYGTLIINIALQIIYNTLNVFTGQLPFRYYGE